MTSYSEKVFAGQIADADDWKQHLLCAHRRDPGMTASVYGAFTTSAGLSSYEALAREVDASQRPGASIDVLDLGCGDAHLFCHLRGRIGGGVVYGCDISPDELAKAEQDHRACVGTQLRLLQCDAAMLPLADRSVDVVLSHMALMLMAPLEPVLLELRRVLRPGGIVSAVIDDPRAQRCPPVVEMWRHIHATFAREYPAIQQQAMGDRRIYDQSGLRELFLAEAGFARVGGLRPVELEAAVSPECFWQQFRTKYLIPELPAAVLEQLAELAVAVGHRHAGADGLLALRIPLQIFTAVC